MGVDPAGKLNAATTSDDLRFLYGKLSCDGFRNFLFLEAILPIQWSGTVC